MDVVSRCCTGLVVSFVLLACAACGTEAEPPLANGTRRPLSRTSADYVVYLRGAITDTLRGEASFGVVVDTRHGRRRFAIVLQSVYDPLGGFFLVQGRAEPPTTGTYALRGRSSESGTDEGFGLVYRLGMRRDLAATSGTLTLTTVRDTLIEGSFEATLEGMLIRQGERLSDARLRVRGTFRAEPQPLDMIVGL